ncbi:secreted RxLR effector protein 161-like [Drosophila ficusphila]|uniref:secreted RxLR effector protein 161-like n=1 Tax=Drosophila ficusphila TaxID=30025 RepID=UPI001C8ABC70|nr:secreted RxLR effector protein 161-like [Drosophila ficusphila]
MFLGMQIEREGELGSITMNQTLYIKDMLQRHGLEQCRQTATTLDPGFQVVCINEHCVAQNPTAYQSAIGELMWLALTSRPDFYHAVVKLAQRNKDAHDKHVLGVKQVMRHLAGTATNKLSYCAGDSALVGYVDADWAGDLRSYTGYVFLLSGGPNSWKSEKQTFSSIARRQS